METSRPSSCLNQCSGRSGEAMSERGDLADLDAREHGDLLRELERTRERLGLDEGPAGDDLLAFGVRSVRHRALLADRRCAAGLGARARRRLFEDLLGVLGHPGLPLRVPSLHFGW